MFDGPWHNNLATGLILALCAVAVFGTGWSYIELETEQRVSEYYEAQTEAQQATDQMLSHCALLPPIERADCVRNAIEAENKRDNETRDLHAQEWMAFWALMMFLATVLMTIVTVIGVIFVGRTLTVTREIGKAQTRGYVHAEKANFFWGGQAENRPRVSLSIVLTGQTPAKWYKVRASHFVIPHEGGPLQIPWGEMSEADTIGRWGGLTASAEGRRVTLKLHSHHESIARVRTEVLRQPTHELYVFGDITYCTFFDEVFVSQFCFGRVSVPPYEKGETFTVESAGLTVNNILEKPIPMTRPACDLVMYQQIQA